MCFKRWVTGLMACALVVGVGCGLKTGEKAPELDPPSFNGKNYSCVGQIPQNVELYVSDELNETQITEFIRCLQKSFTTFTQLTRGKDQNAYAPDEIRRFLQTFFFKERPITDKLSFEFMVIKQVLVGGTTELITRGEIAELIEFLEDIRREAIRLKPHLKYLNPRLVSKQVVSNQDARDIGARLSEANESLKTSIRVMSARMQKGRRDYPFENMAKFMTEFRGFVRWDEHFSDSHPVASWVEFFKVFKGTTVATVAPDVIRPVDWTPFLQNLGRWYLAFIQYQVGVKNQPLLSGVGLQNIMFLAQELFEMSEQSVNRQANKTLTNAQLAKVIASLQDLGWISKKIRPQSIDRVLHTLLDRMYADEKADPNTFRAEGLTLSAIARMRLDFARWATIQMRLNSQFNSETQRQERYRPFVPNLQTNYIPADIKIRLRNPNDPDWLSFQKIKKIARPLFNDNLTRVTLVGNEDLGRYKLSHDFNNLSMMNLMRSAVAVLFRGYATGEDRGGDWTSGISSDELQRFYEDIRDLAVDLTWADQRNKNVGSRAFLEGNLFTYAADGLNYDLTKSRLNFVEAMELVSFLYSGTRTSSDFYTRLSGSCPMGPLDLNGEAKVDRTCLNRTLGELIVDMAINLPGLNAYMRQAPVGERDQLVKNLVDSAYSPKNSNPEWVERNEISIMAVVLHYMEAVLTRYDSNHDGRLTNHEIRKAMPVFVGFVQRFAKDRMGYSLSTREAEGVFLYILAYKKVPDGWSFLKIYDLSFDLFWEFEIRGVKVKVDLNQPIALNRAELSSVFRVIVAKIFDTAPVEEQIRLMNQSAPVAPAPCQIAPDQPLSCVPL